MILLLAGCSSIPSTKSYMATDRDERWINDISYIEKTLPKVHKNLYFKVSEEEFINNLEELKKKVPHISDEEIEIELSRIIASIGDTHTGSSIGSELIYPFELHWFEEGIYIMETTDEYKELLDGRIITINNIRTEDAANMMSPLLAGANESWFKTQVIYYLQIPGILKYFGISSSDEIELCVELADGEVKKVKMKPVDYREYVAAERDDKPVPLYMSRPDENYWYEYLHEDKILYINYSACRQMREKPFEIFSKEVWNFVKDHEVEKFVLDIRNNRGGSSPILDPFIKEIKKSSFNEEGRLYVIIGRDTFSSAVLNAITLIKETNAYFVGEPTGGEPNHYGEVKQFKLPNSEKPIRYSTKYFQNYDKDADSIVPDMIIEETFEAYVKGEDPVLEWIIKN